MLKFKWVVLSVCILLLLSSCGAESAENKADRVAEVLRNADEIIVTANITADYGQRVHDFKIVYTQNDEKTIEIREPIEIAGITVKQADGKCILEYDGAEVSTGVVTRSGISPAEAVPILIEQWKIGGRTGVTLEKSEEAEILITESNITEEIYQCTWFEAETLLPIQSELFENGRMVIRCIFENVIIE